MATGLQNQGEVPENLRKWLAASVRSIQWSYSIFWSTSPAEPGVLEWGEGYYNGDIKTRKTIQARELDDNLIGLQRSEQLRELYESLLAGESTPQARRPSAALSPEDLTNAEWYYLVCMSFSFNLGQGLPGRAFVNERPIWLCNAHYADSKQFSRSLLAKSASIQTVVCFPFLQGVIELGTTELVSEDLSLIEQVKTSLLETPYTTLFTGPNSITPLNNEIIDASLTPIIRGLESPDYSCNSFRPIQPMEDQFMIEGMNDEALQARSWQFIDDELSNCIHTSMNSNDCASRAAMNHENVFNIEKAENMKNDLQYSNHGEIESELRSNDDDLHYRNVLSSIFKPSHLPILGPSFLNSDKESSFACWREGGIRACKKHGDQFPQKMLKKILLELPQEISARKDIFCRPVADEMSVDCVLAEGRMEKVNERFSMLKSLIPSTTKVDTVSVVDDTIAYLKELERRVKELESCRGMSRNRTRAKRKSQDEIERMSYNDCNNNSIGGKRKVSDEKSHISSVDGLYDNMSVSMVERDILIEMECPWRECLLLGIIDALSNLHIDSHSIQSSIADGILSLTIKSELKASGSLSAGMIRRALHRVLQKWSC
ncbi:hypothetical protein Nepgr_031589 [Nepenthes gracilis]|uniref:BHLH domain-containing protein n=1 Tax=Nepenthes gracilis TaxID=150966 RepID=A0AAD3Y7M8_NEPGR|nr:hypothetical protein Nepgr_031589 [Nepenthes gracilis]